MKHPFAFISSFFSHFSAFVPVSYAASMFQDCEQHTGAIADNNQQKKPPQSVCSAVALRFHSTTSRNLPHTPSVLSETHHFFSIKSFTEYKKKQPGQHSLPVWHSFLLLDMQVTLCFPPSLFCGWIFCSKNGQFLSKCSPRFWFSLFWHFFYLEKKTKKERNTWNQNKQKKRLVGPALFEHTI